MVKGNVIRMGDVRHGPAFDGEPQEDTRCVLVIEFGSEEEIRQAIREKHCEFVLFDDSAIRK